MNNTAFDFNTSSSQLYSPIQSPGTKIGKERSGPIKSKHFVPESTLVDCYKKQLSKQCRSKVSRVNSSLIRANSSMIEKKSEKRTHHKRKSMIYDRPVIATP